MHTATHSIADNPALQPKPALRYDDLPSARIELLQAFWQTLVPSSLRATELGALFTNACDFSQALEQIPPQALAIVLSADSINLARYEQTQSFQLILRAIEMQNQLDPASLDSSLNPLAILSLQCAILAYTSIEKLQESKALMGHIIAAGLCDVERARGLFSILEKFFTTHTKLAKESAPAKKPTIAKQALEDELINIANTLAQALPHTKPTLEKTIARLQENRFSIGVAGVLSAGKSSFLNALLGKDVLGTSTIPETANLSILRYGDVESALVHFFTQSEWESASAQDAHSSTLTDEQRELLHMGQKVIAIDELARYTSANYKNGFSALVKKVELHLPLAFLQNNVEIVDTPGLDDPIIIREELTKSYMHHCDMLIYVMNASCAATQKDMDFILESLISRHLARLLVVLTRADLLNSKELESSLAYTRQSLQKELQKAHYDGDIQALLDSIDFIPVASLFALGYKTNDKDIIIKAQAQNFTLEQTGLPKVQAYLESMLLGDDSPKQRDLLYSAYRVLLLELESAKEHLHIEQRILQANNHDKQAIASDLQASNQALIDSMETLNKQLAAREQEFMHYLSELIALINAHLNSHTQRLFTQLYDDAIYEYAKNSKPNAERVESIITQSLQDSYHDLMREYKYKVAKKLRTLDELAKSSNTLALDVSLDIPPITYPSHTNSISALAKQLAKAVLELNAAHTKNTQEKLSAALQELLRAKMGDFISLLTRENTRVQALLHQSFTDYAQAQKDALQDKITKNARALESALTKTATKDDIEALHNTQKTIQSLHNEVQMILKAL